MTTGRTGDEDKNLTDEQAEIIAKGVVAFIESERNRFADTVGNTIAEMSVQLMRYVDTYGPAQEHQHDVDYIVAHAHGRLYDFDDTVQVNLANVCQASFLCF